MPSIALYVYMCAPVEVVDVGTYGVNKFSTPFLVLNT